MSERWGPVCDVEHKGGWRDIKRHTNFISLLMQNHALEESVWLIKSVLRYSSLVLFWVRNFDARYFFGRKISGSCIFLGSQCEASSDPLPQSCILQVTPWSLEDLVLRFEQTISERIHIKKRSQVSLCSYKPKSESLISFLSIFLCVLLCSLF